MHDFELDLHGLIPATVTPMSEDGALDAAALQRYIRWLTGFRGLKAVAVNMDTGEGPALSPEERRQILEIYREEASGLPVLAGIGAPSTRAAVAMAKEAAAAGAAGAVVFPHPVFIGEPLAPEVPYEYHRAIAEACGLPMVVFQLQPALGGVIFSEEALLRLASIPNVIAIKEASFDALRYVETIRVLSAAPKKIQVLTGNDNFIHESFVLGGDGALIGFGTLAVAEQIEMIERHQRGDADGARDIYERAVKPLAGVIFAPPVRDYRARVKEALLSLGAIECAAVRAPLLPLSAPERARVHDATHAAGLAASPGLVAR